MGDHVVVTLIRSCGACAPCAHGEPALCDATFALDEARAADGCRRPPDRPGAPHRGLRRGGRRRRVPGGRDPAGASARPRRAARLRRDHRASAPSSTRPESSPGDSVVVIGTGGVGLNAVQGAVHRGCDHDRRDRSLGRQARDGPGLRRDARGQPGRRGRRRRGPRAHRRARRRLRHRHGRRRGAPSSRARCCCAGRARW